MEGQGESAAVIEASAQGQICPRCGSFAALSQQLGRSLCAPCWLRVIEPGVSVQHVLGDVRRLSARLLLRSWLALIVFNLPLILGGMLYRLGSGKPLPMQVSSLYYLVAMIAEGAILHASHQLLMADPSIEWGAAWRASAQRWGAIFGAAWLSGLITVLFSLLLVIPGILRALSYFITSPIALHERGTAGETLERSTARTRGHRWSILGSALAVSAIGFVPIILLLALFGGIIGAVTGTTLSTGASAVIDVASELSIQGPLALVYFATASLYARCSVRYEQPVA